MKRFFYFPLFLLIMLFSSCLIDIPGSNINNTEIITPPVINSNIPSSVASLITVSDSILDENILLSNEFAKVYTIAKSSLHLAFTDITKFQNKWYIVSRFSEDHGPREFGHIIIFKGDNLLKWELDEIFMQNEYDLRDPKIFVTDNSLHLHFHSTIINPYGLIRNDYISRYNNKSVEWETAKKINKHTSEKSWFWRIGYENLNYFTVSYMTNEPLRYFTSKDGLNFDFVREFKIREGLAEPTIRFVGKDIFMLIRDTKGKALLGRSDDIMEDWKFKELPLINFGGPNLIAYENFLIISGRDDHKTKLFSYNTYSEEFKELFVLPSYGENGYPGMFIDQDRLYMSYYAGPHKGDFLINIAEIDLSTILK